ncbi:hypothetical protein ACRAWD_29165 [Caulobacter segnis]
MSRAAAPAVVNPAALRWPARLRPTRFRSTPISSSKGVPCRAATSRFAKDLTVSTPFVAPPG